MISILYIVALFVIGSFLGWLFEYAVNYPNPKWSFIGSCFPFFAVYGIALVGIYLLYPYIADLPIVIRALIYAALLTILEMTLGIINTAWHGSRTWEYSNKAQISVPATAAWTVLALVAERVMFSV